MNIVSAPKDFAIGLDAEGQPVRRAVAEMTGDEVRSALWLHHVADAADNPRAAVHLLEEAVDLVPDFGTVTGRELIAAMDELCRTAEAFFVKGCLLDQVTERLMPHIQQHPKLSWAELIQRYWPIGRDAMPSQSRH